MKKEADQFIFENDDINCLMYLSQHPNMEIEQLYASCKFTTSRPEFFNNVINPLVQEDLIFWAPDPGVISPASTWRLFISNRGKTTLGAIQNQIAKNASEKPSFNITEKKHNSTALTPLFQPNNYSLPHSIQQPSFSLPLLNNQTSQTINQIEYDLDREIELSSLCDTLFKLDTEKKYWQRYAKSTEIKCSTQEKYAKMLKVELENSNKEVESLNTTICIMDQTNKKLEQKNKELEQISKDLEQKNKALEQISKDLLQTIGELEQKNKELEQKNKAIDPTNKRLSPEENTELENKRSRSDNSNTLSAVTSLIKESADNNNDAGYADKQNQGSNTYCGVNLRFNFASNGTSKRESTQFHLNNINLHNKPDKKSKIS